MARYRLFIKPSAVKEIEDLPKKAVRRRIIERIAALATDPRPHGCEKLSGQERYRIRQGRYRFIYSVDDRSREIVVFKIGHRKDVYP